MIVEVCTICNLKFTSENKYLYLNYDEIQMKFIGLSCIG